jgi:hypothetical protein
LAIFKLSWQRKPSSQWATLITFAFRMPFTTFIGSTPAERSGHLVPLIRTCGESDTDAPLKKTRSLELGTLVPNMNTSGMMALLAGMARIACAVFSTLYILCQSEAGFSCNGRDLNS